MLLYQGCAKSSKNRKIYEKCELKLTFVMKCFQGLSILILLPTLVGGMIMPVWYWIFGFPKPDHWQSLVPTKYSYYYHFEPTQPVFLFILYVFPIFFREFLDPKTVFGYYLSLFNVMQGCFMYFVLFSVTIGFYISLSIYVNAFAEDFKTIISEMNYEIDSGNQRSSKPRSYLIEAVFVQNQKFK